MFINCNMTSIADFYTLYFLYFKSFTETNVAVKLVAGLFEMINYLFLVNRFRFSYATMASPRYLVLVFLLFGGSALILNIHAQPQGFDPNFSGLVTKIFNEFRNAARDGDFNDFAVLVMITPQQMVNWDVQFYPQDAEGHPLIDSGHSLSPHQEANYNNFIVATSRHYLHSERIYYLTLNSFKESFWKLTVNLVPSFSTPIMHPVGTA